MNISDYHSYRSDEVKLCNHDNVTGVVKIRASGFFRPTTTSKYRFYFYSTGKCDTCRLHMDLGSGLVSLLDSFADHIFVNG